MYIYKKIGVRLNERVVAFRDSLPLRALPPGRHTLWGTRLSEQRFVTDTLTFTALPEVCATLPLDWYAKATIEDGERGILYRDGKPQSFLRPGVHRYWTLDPSVELKRFQVDAPMPRMSNEPVNVVPASEYVLARVSEHERGLHYVQGRLEYVLSPGRYALWTHPEGEVRIVTVDMRRQQLAISGQDLITRDKVSLRLTLTVQYSVADAALTTHSVADARDTIYLLVQLAARDYVAGTSLDALLEGGDEMTQFLEHRTTEKAAAFGIRIDAVGVKDIILPGEMKTLLNRVIEAEKEAAASVILRREETAATRALANTARVMADNPVLLRLKELEAMKEIASNIHEVRIVVGTEGLEQLMSSHLLSPPKAQA